MPNEKEMSAETDGEAFIRWLTERLSTPEGNNFAIAEKVNQISAAAEARGMERAAKIVENDGKNRFEEWLTPNELAQAIRALKDKQS